MVIVIGINCLVLSQALKSLITDHLDEVRIYHHFFEPHGKNPDIVLFTALDRIEELMQAYGQSKFICMDLGLRESDLACLLSYYGISGIISPALDTKMFCKALLAIHGGEVWVEQSHLKIMLSKSCAHLAQEGARELSSQDKKIIHLVVNGLTNNEIAKSLCLSEPTIKAHLSRIYKILRVSNRTSLVVMATEHGWMNP